MFKRFLLVWASLCLFCTHSLIAQEYVIVRTNPIAYLGQAYNAAVEVPISIRSTVELRTAYIRMPERIENGNMFTSEFGFRIYYQAYKKVTQGCYFGLIGLYGHFWSEDESGLSDVINIEAKQFRMLGGGLMWGRQFDIGDLITFDCGLRFYGVHYSNDEGLDLQFIPAPYFSFGYRF